jgi:Fe-S-cluster containining protein
MTDDAEEIRLPPDLQRPIAITLQAHEAMQRAYDDLLAEAAARDDTAEVACRAGCAACCVYLVDCISSEGQLIAASIENGDPNYKAAVMARLLDWEHEFHRWLRTHPMPQRSEDDDALNDEHDLWRGFWQARRIACPFLDLDTNCCSIYQDRPSVCVGHHACYPPSGVVNDIPTPPPEGCFTKWEDVNAGHLTPIWQLNAELCTTFSQVLAKSLEARGIQWTLYFLPLMVLREGRRHFGWPPVNPNARRAKPPRVTTARKEPQ